MRGDVKSTPVDLLMSTVAIVDQVVISQSYQRILATSIVVYTSHQIEIFCVKIMVKLIDIDSSIRMNIVIQYHRSASHSVHQNKIGKGTSREYDSFAGSGKGKDKYKE